MGMKSKADISKMQRKRKMMFTLWVVIKKRLISFQLPELFRLCLSNFLSSADKGVTFSISSMNYSVSF